MRTVLVFLLAVVSLIGFACKKESHNTIFKAKYLDQSCLPIIQIIEPSDNRFKESVWEKNDSTYVGSVSIFEIPEKYKDGRVFSFTLSQVQENVPMRDDCLRPKYYIIIDEWIE